MLFIHMYNLHLCIMHGRRKERKIKNQSAIHSIASQVFECLFEWIKMISLYTQITYILAENFASYYNVYFLYIELVVIF